ncbi:DNA-directed RNA polymerase beta subunit [Sporolactobacillus inulinus]|uniref:DNA-directed RNA polymerase beta subunit n=1 Tax=Sporolactobacillus inulinus TaxID=2078 RepID=A0A4Y1ZF01_9BACL|nr:DNA-directed RNA polymerase beta subunit [Sporolactobacillus inulinus]
MRIDRTRKVPVTVLLRSLGFSTDQEIIDLLGEDDYLRNTLEKDNTDSTDKALVEIYERLRPGEPPTVENAKSLLEARFFDPKRYDLANVGRYKMNKKLHIKNRLFNQRLAQKLVDPETGEIVADEGTLLDRRTLDRLLPTIEKKLGFVDYTPSEGVIAGQTIRVQKIDVYSPLEEDKGKVVSVMSNCEIDRSIKHITPADILFFNQLFL